MRSVSIASDGSSLVAGNHKVRQRLASPPVCTVANDQARTGHRLRVEYPTGTHVHLAATQDQVSGALAVPHQGARVARYQVRPSPSFSFPSRPTQAYYTPCRNIATCSADTTIKIWSANSSAAASAGAEGGGAGAGKGKGTVDTSSAYTLDKVLQGHQRWVWDMAYSADSAYLVSGELICRGRRTEEWWMLTYVGELAASSDHTARLWELASGTTVRQVSCSESEMNGEAPTRPLCLSWRCARG